MDDSSVSARSSWNEALCREAIAPHVDIAGGLLPALHAVQARFGFVPDHAIALLAASFNISRAEIFGVVSFYHDFQTTAPQGNRVLALCRAEACQAVGGESLAEFARARLGITWGETSSDRAWTLRQTFCLGLCACGPAAIVDGKPLARLDRIKLDSIIGESSA